MGEALNVLTMFPQLGLAAPTALSGSGSSRTQVLRFHILLRVNFVVPPLKLRGAQVKPEKRLLIQLRQRRTKKKQSWSHMTVIRLFPTSEVNRGGHVNIKSNLVNERSQILIFIVTIEAVLEQRMKRIGSRVYLI